MQINYCLFFLNEFFIFIYSLSCYKYWAYIKCWTLKLICLFLIMQFIKNFINNDMFVNWYWIKFVLQFCTDNFLIVFKMNLYSIFFWYINNLSDFWSYSWISSYYLINQIQICILMNLNFKWNADIFIDDAEQNSEILSENRFLSTVCCIWHNKWVNQNLIHFFWF